MRTDLLSFLELPPPPTEGRRIELPRETKENLAKLLEEALKKEIR